MEPIKDEIKSAKEVGEILEQVSGEPDEKTTQEAKFSDKFNEEVVSKFHNDNIARKVYAELIFTVTVMWLFFVLVTVIAVGRGFLKLSDTVLVTLITTTTIAVFGFFLAVVNYYFNKEKST